ncbi:hypothetical protein J5N97_008228 [Dioscorea zingiberensis]|uniref:Uncharacterized protein n=1 Tax=Dioscorea zingiberensis TaxID=325984 RepID=A0A9D5DIS6_9LILI|nr:hypothetical protein J5N97_008228 [Dioscorea zingiberensis]
MEMEEVWSDLHALRKLYGLLQRTNGVMIPQGECQDILDERSRHLLKKLLDGATQEAIQCQSKILSKSSTELPKEEPKCNPPSLEVPEEKVQQEQKPETEPNPCHTVCKRAELKHQKSDKTMKTGLDLKPRKRSEHLLPDVHRRILQDRHRTRSEVSSSGDPNQPRPSGSLLVRNPSRLGRSSKRSRVDAPGRARPFPRPVDESTRYRRAGDTNSVSSHVIKPPVTSTRPLKVNQTAEIAHSRKKEVGPTESKPSHKKERNKLSGTSRPSPRQLRTEMSRVKPIRYSSMTSSDSTATGSPSSSTGPESRTSDETLSRRRVPRRSPHLIARSSVPILVHGEKSLPRRMLSQQKMGPTRRRSTSKDLPREQEKRRGRLKRVKDKLALIFHHHHHHHHHYHHHRPGHVDGDGEVVQGNNHASPWRYLRRAVGNRNSKEEKGKMAPRQQRLGLLHVLLDALLRHVWGTPQRRAAQAKRMRLGNAGKKPRWWQVFRRRGGLKLANQNKPRLKLGFNRAHSGAQKKNLKLKIDY